MRNFILVIFCGVILCLSANFSVSVATENNPKSPAPDESPNTKEKGDLTVKDSNTSEFEKNAKTQKVYDKLQSECQKKCSQCNVFIVCDDRGNVPKCSCICKDCQPLQDKIPESSEGSSQTQKELEPSFLHFCSSQEERCYSKYALKSQYVMFTCDDRENRWKSSCIAEMPEKKKEGDQPKP